MIVARQCEKCGRWWKTGFSNITRCHLCIMGAPLPATEAAKGSPDNPIEVRA